MSDSLTSIQTLINTASSDGRLSEGTFLGDALGKALGALEGTYKVNSFLQEPKGDEYTKMFSEINENFGTLFAELNRIRSSFLPLELEKEVPDQDGNNLSFEEIVNSESVLESYENAFFRMLGMPSSANIQDNIRLTYIAANGVKKRTGLSKDQYTSRILDARQLGRASRPIVNGDEIYSLTKASNPYLGLINAGFEELDVLADIISGLKFLRNVDDPTTKEAGDLAQAIVTKTIKNSKEKDDSGQWNAASLSELASNFGLKSNNDARRDDRNSAFNSNAGAFSDVSASSDLIIREMLRYAILSLEPSIPVSEDTLSVLFNSEILGQADPSLRRLDLADNFWKYHYLLFPPIQDERIEKCINEPGKIVAEPFLPKALRTINRVKMKSTLLEAVIRIRLDVISGTTVTYPSGGSQAPSSIGSLSKNITYEGIKNQLGLLEALLIARLFTALYGMALDIRSKVKSMHIIQSKAGLEANAKEETDTIAATQVEVETESDERAKFRLIKTVEDSIFLLLGENTSPEVLDLQEGTVRSSAIKEAHLMSAVLAAIDIPRRWASSKIEDIDSRNIRAADKGDISRAGVASKLGISKGVGAIDVLAFIIAFFSVPEEVLLSLLSDQQFDYMKAEFPAGFFDGFALELNIADAVQKVADAAYDAYELVRLVISSEDSGLFVYND